MKPNEYIKPDQQKFIDDIKLGTVTKGMNRGVAHDIRLIESTLLNATNGIKNKLANNQMKSQKHNDHVFGIILRNVELRDDLVRAGNEKK